MQTKARRDGCLVHRRTSMEIQGENLFSLLVLRRNRHVETNSVSGSLYTFLSRQVNKGVVTIQERLGIIEIRI